MQLAVKQSYELLCIVIQIVRETQPCIVQQVSVYRNHCSNTHSQTASQSCVVETTAFDLWW